jgi:hypothetical protein
VNFGQLLAGIIKPATDTAAASATSAIQGQWEQVKPYAMFLSLLAAIVFIFFFMPRFRLPWEKAA